METREGKNGISSACEELPELSETPLEIKDFTMINDWEKVISNIEDIVIEWNKEIIFSSCCKTNNIQEGESPKGVSPTASIHTGEFIYSNF